MSFLSHTKSKRKHNGRYEQILICFKPTTTKWFWKKILDPEFGHVFIMMKIDGQYLVLEPTIHGLNIKLENDAYPELLKEKLNIKILDVPCPPKKFVMYSAPFFVYQSCVMWAKYCIGICCPWVLSPKQLYLFLLKNCEAKKI